LPVNRTGRQPTAAEINQRLAERGAAPSAPQLHCEDREVQQLNDEIMRAGALLAAATQAAPPEDGKAAFERREDTMKHMGRPFYLGIGRVVKGTTAYGPDTVTAAETVATLASTLNRTLYPPGSDVAESKIIFAANDHVD
jgi:hypothetical protein